MLFTTRHQKQTNPLPLCPQPASAPRPGGTALRPRATGFKRPRAGGRPGSALPRERTWAKGRAPPSSPSSPWPGSSCRACVVCTERFRDFLFGSILNTTAPAPFSRVVFPSSPSPAAGPSSPPAFSTEALGARSGNPAPPGHRRHLRAGAIHQPVFCVRPEPVLPSERRCPAGALGPAEPPLSADGELPGGSPHPPRLRTAHSRHGARRRGEVGGRSHGTWPPPAPVPSRRPTRRPPPPLSAWQRPRPARGSGCSDPLPRGTKRGRRPRGSAVPVSSAASAFDSTFCLVWFLNSFFFFFL